jgi:tetratricopeptide (TPR) repeat protein
MKKIITILFLLLAFTSCKRQDEWLDVKSNKADVIPQTLKDFQAIIDNNSVMCFTPAMGMLSADNYFVTDASALTAGTVPERNAYVWASDIYQGATSSTDWNAPYAIVEYSNVILDGLKKLDNSQNPTDFNNVRGSALFFRAFGFFNVAQIYAKPYASATASTDLGIPLRLNSDINDVSVRPTLQATYDRIITDLKESVDLLPVTPLYKTRPGKEAAYALLAKAYLIMGDYQKAYDNADNALKINSSLLNYNSISGTPTYPFPTYQTGNAEIVLYATMISYTFNLVSQLVVDDLYSQYDAKDLRKSLFYKVNTDGTKTFRGRYTGTSTYYSGISTNELYLIKAECQARLGNFGESMNTLNALLTTRWLTGTYIPYTATTTTAALNIILKERRKELPFTGNLRWEDLRRLNLDPQLAITLIRTVSGKVYTLPPNDPKYTFPIPPSEMNINPLPQNNR